MRNQELFTELKNLIVFSRYPTSKLGATARFWRKSRQNGRFGPLKKREKFNFSTLKSYFFLILCQVVSFRNTQDIEKPDFRFFNFLVISGACFGQNWDFRPKKPQKSPKK